MNSYHQKIHEKRYTKTRTCEAKVTKRSLEKVTNLVSLSYKKSRLTILNVVIVLPQPHKLTP